MATVDQEDLPRTNVKRIVKNKLMELVQNSGDDDVRKKEVQINKDALLALCESAKVFIHYLSSIANEICHESNRQTINAEDVLKAVEELDFGQFLDPLQTSLADLRQEQQMKKAEAKKRPSVPRKRKASTDEGEAHENAEGQDHGQDDAGAHESAEGGAGRPQEWGEGEQHQDDGGEAYPGDEEDQQEDQEHQAAYRDDDEPVQDEADDQNQGDY